MSLPRVFLGLGECMVELAPGGPEGLLRQGFAGDVFNTLWYAARALGPGWQVRFHTALGVDPLSDELAAFAAQGGVDCAAAPRVAGRMPGLYMIRLSPDGERSFLYWRESSAARALMRDRALVQAQMAAAEVIYLSGITLAILPPAEAEALIALMAEARAAGRLVAFDPNLRPRLWDCPERMRRTVTAAAQASSVILPSHEDEAAAFGDQSPAETAARYGAQSGAQVVVKNAAGPVVVWQGGAPSSHPTPALGVRPVDTTAAGDSFNAAYLAEYLRGAPLAQAVAAGQARAAATIMGKGALVP